MTSSARDQEMQLLARCQEAVRNPELIANNAMEANVFRFSALLLTPRSGQAKARLLQAATPFFSQHPDARLAPAEVIRQGWIIGAPRWRQLLESSLNAS